MYISYRSVVLLVEVYPVGVIPVEAHGMSRNICVDTDESAQFAHIPVLCICAVGSIVYIQTSVYVL